MECTQVHLINVCFSPKIRLKLVKMALSSTMVSLGFYERVCEYVCFILLSVCSCWNVIICILHAVPLNLNAKHVYLLPPIFYIFFLLSILLPLALRFSHHSFGHGRHDEYDLRMVGEPSEV